MLSSQKDYNAAVKDMKKTLVVYNECRLMRKAVSAWKEGLNAQLMTQLRHEIAETYRKKTLLVGWGVAARRQRESREKIQWVRQ